MPMHRQYENFAYIENRKFFISQKQEIFKMEEDEDLEEFEDDGDDVKIELDEDDE